jgi:hypothetical protein
LDSNVIAGWLGIGLGTLCVLMAMVIAGRQYVWPQPKLAAGGGGGGDVLKILVDLLVAILKAPPALAFLVVGLMLIGGGGWVLSTKPF